MNGKAQSEHMFSGSPPKADLAVGSSPTLREQRRQHGAALVGQFVARRPSVALDQTPDHHLLRRGVGDAGGLPVRVGGEAEQEEPFGHGEFGCDGWRRRVRHHSLVQARFGL